MTFKGQEVSVPGLPSVQPRAPNLYTLRPRSSVVRQGSARGRRGVRMIQKEELRGMKDQRWGRQRPFLRTPADQPDHSGRSVPATLSPAGYSPRVAKSQTTERSTARHLLRTQTVPSLLAYALFLVPFPQPKLILTSTFSSTQGRGGRETPSAPGFSFFYQLCSKITSGDEG